MFARFLFCLCLASASLLPACSERAGAVAVQESSNFLADTISGSAGQAAVNSLRRTSCAAGRGGSCY